MNEYTFYNGITHSSNALTVNLWAPGRDDPPGVRETRRPAPPTPSGVVALEHAEPELLPVP